MTEFSGIDTESMAITSDLAERVQEELGENVFLCYQCVKCTSGCPVTEYFDWQPNQIMRAVQLGQNDIALESQTPWLCAACQTCTTRCPQGLDIAAIMEFLARESVARGFEPQVPAVDHLNKAFLREVKIWGRAYEPGMMAERFIRRPQDMFEDVQLYIKMLKKRKVSFLPKISRPPKNVKTNPEAASSIAYYPGCSLHSTGKEYDISTRAVCETIGLKLIEPKGWVCCGSSAAHKSDPELAAKLPMENLALIEQSGFSEVTMPCAACFHRHRSAQYEMRHDEQHKAEVDAELGYTYQDTVDVSTLSTAILNHVGPDDVADKVKRPLEGLRVVCYYGCLLTRPPEITGAEHPDNPTDIDQLMEALGAEVVDWSYKTSCCGAAHTLTQPEIVIDLSGGLVNHAREAGADAIVVACPLCHANLDARQFQMDIEGPMPVLYFTQLMALAMGLSAKDAAFEKNVTDPRPLLRDKGLLAA
jgi:heterodisulfide reductase subunit B